MAQGGSEKHHCHPLPGTRLANIDGSQNFAESNALAAAWLFKPVKTVFKGPSHRLLRDAVALDPMAFAQLCRRAVDTVHRILAVYSRARLMHLGKLNQCRRGLNAKWELGVIYPAQLWRQLGPGRTPQDSQG